MSENNTDNPAIEENKNSGAITPPERSNAKGKGNYLVKIIVTLLIVVSAAYGYYLWKKNNTVDIAVQQTADSPVDQSKMTSTTIKELESRLNGLNDQQKIILDSLSALYQQQPVNNEDWALAEIEYLLIIATHHLSLLNDVDTALDAMNAAELRLRDMRDQQLTPVKDQLASDINQLQSVNAVDLSSLAIYLADLINRSDTLPLKNDIKIVAQDDSENTDMTRDDTGRSNVFDTIWQELKSLVIIKRSGEVKPELLLPEQEYFLFQNLRLELENARLSVLRHDTENLRTSIDILNDWLSRYFDTKDTEVMNVLETLAYMNKVELSPRLPDISSSLENLRAYMRARESAESLPEQNTEAPAP